MGLIKALSLNHRVNLFGLTAAFLLFYTASSNKPWWTLTGGLGDQHTFSARVSPFAVAVEILGKLVTTQIIPYITLAARLSILPAAATILVGSLLANKPWSKPMMSTRLNIAHTFPVRAFRRASAGWVLCWRKPSLNREIQPKIRHHIWRIEHNYNDAHGGGSHAGVLGRLDGRDHFYFGEGNTRQDITSWISSYLEG